MLTVQYGFRFYWEIMSFSDLMLFALSSNQELAQRVSREMGLPLGESQRFVNFLMEKFRLILKNQSVGKMFIFCNPLAHRLTII